MNLQLDINCVSQFKSNTQKIRVLTEDWVSRYIFCPICGNNKINHYENNKPVADFYCDKCKHQYELKSTKGKLGNKITDGSYKTMIERITELENPNFLFLTYNQNYHIDNFILIPNHFFTPSIIEKRKPLSDNARRAGWTGCNIILKNIPAQGRIHIIKHGLEIDKTTVLSNYKKIQSLTTKDLDSRGWLMDALWCIDKISSQDFTLKDIYAFEEILQKKHPNNHFIKDKIRQQLQYLRDKGFIEFKSRGNYKKI